MIVDDGGDATLLVHKGVEFEAAGAVPQPGRRTADGVGPRAGHPDRRAWPRTTSGSPGWRRHPRASARRPRSASAGSTGWPPTATLLFPAFNVNDSVTKSKFDNKYGIRHSLVDGLNRATDVMLAGKLVVVCGYGDVGKGAAEALRGQGARVVVTEIDPICALQAAMEGMQVVRLDDVVDQADVVITTTGERRHRHGRPALARLKHNAIVANVGHFDDEIDMAGLARIPGIVKTEIKPLVHEWRFPDGHSVIVLVRGPPDEPGQRDRPPELRDVQLVHQPDHGPDRAVHPARGVRGRTCTGCRSTSTRRWPGCTSTRSGSA